MNLIPRAQKSVSTVFRRNIGFTAILAQKAVATDPIQKLFLQKLKDYSAKSSAAGGKLVDATPETQKELNTELDRIAKVYGGGSGVDMTKLPNFDFKDPPLDPINQVIKE